MGGRVKVLIFLTQFLQSEKMVLCKSKVFSRLYVKQ
jgi:hypothetical protein